MVDFESCLESNRISQQRLRCMVEALSDEDLRRPVGGGWTVSATLAHLAFWDQQIERWLGEWERRGFRTTVELEDWDRSLDGEYWYGLNDELLPEWSSAEPRKKALAAIAAANSLDRKIESLDLELVGAILGSVLFKTRIPWVLRRGGHRNEHLDQIEQALAPRQPRSRHTGSHDDIA